MQKIPKIIHYCWFGKNPKSLLIQNCMLSWQKYLPDYEIKQWNEDSFDINSNLYVKQAYQAKKWAFVSDYVRLYALYHEGGIYLDTDVEVFKNLDKFLMHSAFSGFERTYKNDLSPITAVMGASKHNPWIENLLADYQHRPFILNGELDLTTNTATITQQLINQYNIKINDKYQHLADDIHIYPSDYFCCQGKNTYTVHHFNGSWKSHHRKFLSKILQYIYKFIKP